jgi:23S rRNA (cytidine1920-2'-O)/16S rRNA (cytidine1409-2'-O)-methyltransferase
MAQAAIMAGLVYVNGVKQDKPGYGVNAAAVITVRQKDTPYVSRGGLKLAKAIKVFKLDFTGKVVLDAGASTGGFTDCALHHGADLVYAVDVNYGQLAWSLRQDPRVQVLERTNIRHVVPEQLAQPPDIVLADLSFISLTKVLPQLFRLLTATGEGVALIKPQFEAPRELVGEKGVVRDGKTHEAVLEKIVAYIENHGGKVLGLDYSPITGPAGNIEYLVHFAGSGQFVEPPPSPFDITDLVAQAEAELSPGSK